MIRVKSWTHFKRILFKHVWCVCTCMCVCMKPFNIKISSCSITGSACIYICFILFSLLNVCLYMTSCFRIASKSLKWKSFSHKETYCLWTMHAYMHSCIHITPTMHLHAWQKKEAIKTFACSTHTQLHVKNFKSKIFPHLWRWNVFFCRVIFLQILFGLRMPKKPIKISFSCKPNLPNKKWHH